MFCYVYGDYFGLYIPDKLASVAQGKLGPLGPATPEILVAVSVMMAMPGLLIASASLAPAAICRWSHILLGLLYTAIVAISTPGAEPFYIVLSIIEMLLTASVALVAFNWPVIEGEGK